MSTHNERRIVLFGGQGSFDIFSSTTASVAEKDARLNSAGSMLLSRCHAAFLEEIRSLDDSSHQSLAIDLAHFSFPTEMLRPRSHYHAHPVIQITTIYLVQLLHYLGELRRVDESIESSFLALEESSGFSCGMLPALVVARSPDLDTFLPLATEVFRLAFWIACRSHLWGLKHEKEKSGSTVVEDEASYSLVVRGSTRPELDGILEQDYAQMKTRGNVHVSAIAPSGAVSLSGPKAELEALRTGSLSSFRSAFINVQGWYHGGDQLEPLVRIILSDAKARAIEITESSTIPKITRSTFDGSAQPSIEMKSGPELMEWAVQHLVIHCADWEKTALQLARSVDKILQRDSILTIKIISMGPSSSTLFPRFDQASERVGMIDDSPWKAAKEVHASSELDGIAIVGQSVHLPRGNGTEELWETLSNGLSAVQEIPESRFKISEHFSDRDSHSPRSMSTKHGAFLDDPFSFDNEFFNISPREAKSMDPQQRLLLHGAQEALEDAGWVADSTPSSARASTGCYIGLATGDYTDNLRNDIDVFYSPGTLRAFHSGRISYHYGLSGPSIVMDTACSSSIVAIRQACQALELGDCTTAIAGGVNVISSPDMYLGLARGHFLSSTGGCKPFDSAADGYCRAEGCVVFVLKRLSTAVADNDRIHGVIRGSSINQSGTSHSITHPHSQTQIDLFQRVLSESHIDPASIGVIEAHGTGTNAGDKCEIESLRSVFHKDQSPEHPIAISSIKGNISHCEAASGAAGLSKLLLMLQKKEIPVQAGLQQFMPQLGNIRQSGLFIPKTTIPWSHAMKTPRRALLNNFGAAGSNTSLILEEWPQSAREDLMAPSRSAYMFNLSAKSHGALQASIQSHLYFLRQHPKSSLADICYTASACRHTYDYLISLKCSSVMELQTNLQYHDTEQSKIRHSPSSVVFVFSGQGSIYSGMGKELLRTTPLFREIITDCDGILTELGYPSLLPMFDDSVTDTRMLGPAEQILVSQCACVALQYGLARMFISWGIVPRCVIGHSLGEYAALCCSGVLTLADTLHIVAYRAKLMTEKCNTATSGMIACKIAATEAKALIAARFATSSLTVACSNGSDDCVIGGSLNQIHEFYSDCKARHIKAKILEVPYAFHTAAMDPILESLDAFAQSISFQKPDIEVYSNVYGRPFELSDLSADYFSRHAREPVLFAEGMLDMKNRDFSQHAVYLELGPHPQTLPFVRDVIQSESCIFKGTLQRGKDAWDSICMTLESLSHSRLSVDWRQVFNGTNAKLIDLPGHPLNGKTFKIPYQENLVQNDLPAASPRDRYIDTGHQLLPRMDSSLTSDHEQVFETSLEVLGPLISGHNVSGTSICPASLYHELGLEGAQETIRPSKAQTLTMVGFAFEHPLIYSSTVGDATAIRVRLMKSERDGMLDFKMSSHSSINTSETTHCRAKIILQDVKMNKSHRSRDLAFVRRQSRHFTGASKRSISTFRTKTLYEAVFTRVVSYSSEYQTLTHLSVADSNLEGIGSFKLPVSSEESHYVVPPQFTDTLLHAPGFIANLVVGSTEVAICAHVDTIEIDHCSIDFAEEFTIYCSLLEVQGALIAESIVIDGSNKVVAVARGIEFKRLRQSSFQQILSHGSQGTRNQAYVPNNDPAPHLDHEPAPLITDDDTDDSTETSKSEHSDLRGTLQDIVSEISGFSKQSLESDKSLDELGIDSLMQIEITSKISHTFPTQAGLDHQVFSDCETLASLENTLASILRPSTDLSRDETALSSTLASTNVTSAPTRLPTPVNAPKIPSLLHRSPNKTTPICLFHDGSGQINTYAQLQVHDRSTYAFADPHFGSPRRPVTSIKQMVDHYVSFLSKAEMSPIILGGWSFGGVLAFEAAHQLLARGFKVMGLVLIDSPSPVDHEPLPDEVVAEIIGSGRQNHALKEEFHFNASLLGIYKAAPLPHSDASGAFKTVMLRSQDVLDTESLCGIRYDWLSEQRARDAAIGAWEGMVGGQVEVLPIPGNHFDAFSPANIAHTASQLFRACRIIEAFHI